MPRGVNAYDEARLQERNVADANSVNIVSPGLVTDGLVLHLDAGNFASYPAAGTTWRDATTPQTTVSLVNGPTYSNLAGGALVFDGVNDYAELSTRDTKLEFQPTQAFSVFCWVYNLSQVVGGATIVSNLDSGSPFTGWDLWTNSTTTLSAHIISSWSSSAVKVLITFDFSGNANKWVQVGYRYNGTSPATSTDAVNSIDFYVNGQLTTTNKANNEVFGFSSTTATTTYNANQRFRVASRYASGGANFPRALTVGQALVYAKMLSNTEIQQNFNATRARFGV